jgi:hypothetical protein
MSCHPCAGVREFLGRRDRRHGGLIAQTARFVRGRGEALADRIDVVHQQ